MLTYPGTWSGSIDDLGTKTIYLGVNYPNDVQLFMMDTLTAQTSSVAGNPTFVREYIETDNRIWNHVTGGATGDQMDVIYQPYLPADFRAWANGTAIDIEYKTDSATATCTFAIMDSTGATAIISSAQSNASVTLYGFSGASLTGTYTAGKRITVRCRSRGGSAANVRFGRVRLHYLPEGLKTSSGVSGG
jgi:hypothetical protein